jgi:hypothetical protein
VISSGSGVFAALAADSVLQADLRKQNQLRAHFWYNGVKLTYALHKQSTSERLAAL